MRNVLITSLVLAAAAALAIAATATGARDRAGRDGRIPGCAPARSTCRRRRAHDRRRQPRLPALVRRRREDEAVEGLRPVQRQGLRVGRRVRGRDAARLHEGEVKWTVVPFNNSFRPGKKPFDFYVTQVSYSPERARAVDFSSVLLRQPGGRRAQGHADREGEVDRGAEAVQARRPGRDDELHVHQPVHQAVLEAARLRHERRRRAGAQERPDRRDRRRPADRVLRHRRAGRRRRDRRQAAHEGHEGALRACLPEGQRAPAVRRPGDRAGSGRTGRSRSSRTRISRRPARPT